MPNYFKLLQPMSTPSGTTIYPSKYYNISTSSVTKQIFANEELVSTITGTSTNAVISYIHNDHLNSTNVVSNSSAGVNFNK